MYCRRRFNSRRNVQPPRHFNLERFLFRTTWNFYHIVFTIVALAWAGVHGYDDVRTLFNKVVSAHESAAPSAAPCACHKNGEPHSP